MARTLIFTKFNELLQRNKNSLIKSMNWIINELTNYKTAEKQGNRKLLCYTPLEQFPLTSPSAKKHVIILVVHEST